MLFVTYGRLLIMDIFAWREIPALYVTDFSDLYEYLQIWSLSFQLLRYVLLIVIMYQKIYE